MPMHLLLISVRMDVWMAKDTGWNIRLYGAFEFGYISTANLVVKLGKAVDQNSPQGCPRHRAIIG